MAAKNRNSLIPETPPPVLDDLLGYQLWRATIRTNDIFFQAAGVPLKLRCGNTPSWR